MQVRIRQKTIFGLATLFLDTAGSKSGGRHRSLLHFQLRQFPLDLDDERC